MPDGDVKRKSMASRPSGIEPKMEEVMAASPPPAEELLALSEVAEQLMSKTERIRNREERRMETKTK